MTFSWPEHILPLPQQNIAVESNPYLVKNEFEVGLRQRLKYSYNTDTLSVSWMFNQFEFDLFKKTIQLYLSMGCESFEITLIGVDGLAKIENVVIDGGLYRWNYVPHMHYNVQATLRVTNPPLAPETAVRLLVEMPVTAKDFMEASSVLYTYIENFYGHSEDSELIQSFIEKHS